MKIPRVRISVRRLMAVVAAAAALSWLVFRWDPDTGRSDAVGHKTIPLAFSVFDADTGRPIEGAVIRLLDFDYESNPIPPYFLELETGRDGRATTSLSLMFGESRGIPSNKLINFRANYPEWDMYITATGYQGVFDVFAHYERENPRFHENTPPSPIVFRLRRGFRSDSPKNEVAAHKMSVLSRSP